MKQSILRGVSANGPATATLVEQAKGVLIFRFGVDGDRAVGLLESWAEELEVTVGRVAHTIVHHVCRPRDGAGETSLLERRLKERLLLPDPEPR